ncbi:MAG: hypothetical protein Q4G43_06120 [Mobilicoccus sp.]|nr:hypothetical protein [Mobilicoccus sp.]
MRDTYVEVDSGRYAAIDFGGSGPDILLLHDLMSTAEIWRPFAGALSEFSHAVALDLCGHGRTLASPETLRTLVDDLAPVVRTLGLRDPLVVVGQEEHLALFEEPLREIGTRAALVAFAYNSYRGQRAREERDESLGAEALAAWTERSRLFISGEAGTQHEFVEERVAAASADWVNHGVDIDQLRRYFERQVRPTEQGWERVPRRPIVEETLRHVDEGALGLDALDVLDIPVWAMVAWEVGDVAELDRFETWAMEQPGRRIVPVSDAVAVDAVDPDLFASIVRDLLALPEVSAPRRDAVRS